MAIQLNNSAGALLAAAGKPVRAGTFFDALHARAYNQSVDFKLQSADYYLAKLANVLQDFPFDGSNRGPNMFEVALFIDGFFASAVSVTDVFGRELNVYFGNIVHNDKFYFHDVVGAIQGAAKGVGILHSLAAVSVQNTGLIAQLKKYRNCSSHSRLINSSITMSTTLDYEQHRTTGPPLARVDCFLPDDPLIIPCTYINRVPAFGFCQTALAQLTAALDAAYAHLTADVQNAADLPL
jgi:hypothetical protein